MAKIRNSRGDGFLTWANGDFIDSDHMENDVDVVKLFDTPQLSNFLHLH